VLAARQGRRAWQAGRPVAFEVAVVLAMVLVSIGEVDLDRAMFGTKVISTRFFVSPRYSLAARGVAVAVIVGVPIAVGVWLLTRWRQLWLASLEGLREPSSARWSTSGRCRRISPRRRWSWWRPSASSPALRLAARLS